MLVPKSDPPARELRMIRGLNKGLKFFRHQWGYCSSEGSSVGNLEDGCNRSQRFKLPTKSKHATRNIRPALIG